MRLPRAALPVFLLATLLLLKWRAPAASAHQTPSPSNAGDPNAKSPSLEAQRRVILVYPLHGCEGTFAEASTDSLGSNESPASDGQKPDVPFRKGLDPLAARHLALSVLERRINERLSRRSVEASAPPGQMLFSSLSSSSSAPNQNIEPSSTTSHTQMGPLKKDLRDPSTIERQQPQRTSDTTIDVNDVSSVLSHRRHLLPPNDQTSIRLETRYLEALHMEIAEVPTALSEDELLHMASTVPCVEKVARDYVKHITDNVGESDDDDEQHNDLSASLLTSQPAVSQRRLGPKRLNGNTTAANVAANSTEEKYRERILPTWAGATFPNDRHFQSQWHLQPTSMWGIGAERVWNHWRGSKDLVVAVIDSGCDFDHPDLIDQRWRNPGEICDDGIDNDGNGYIDDCYGWDWVDDDNDPAPAMDGHGTAAAGIIAASTNNWIGVAGICWECRVMCLRFIHNQTGLVSHQVSAINYAAKMGAKISNNSYGAYGFSWLEQETIRRAYELGHLFVTSAGNNNRDTDLPENNHTPSVYDVENIVAVGASKASGSKARFSNYGKNSVDVFAPGNRIMTVSAETPQWLILPAREACTYNVAGGGYKTVSGTSFAAPMVAGAAALVWSRYPTLSIQEIVTLLMSSCRQSDDLLHYSVCGGVIDMEVAMDIASQWVDYVTPDADPIAPLYSLIRVRTPPPRAYYDFFVPGPLKSFVSAFRTGFYEKTPRSTSPSVTTTTTTRTTTSTLSTIAKQPQTKLAKTTESSFIAPVTANAVLRNPPSIHAMASLLKSVASSFRSSNQVLAKSKLSTKAFEEVLRGLQRKAHSAIAVSTTAS